MDALLRHAAFWSFQVINTVTALLMTFVPRHFHESLFDNPARAYAILGFSDTAVSMVHNVIRGHGAVLLAVSLFLWVQMTRARSSFLLIFLVCALSAYAHSMTLLHHLRTDAVVQAIGNFGSLYFTIALISAIGILNLLAWLRWDGTAHPRR
jgi:hypothetical protein